MSTTTTRSRKSKSTKQAALFVNTEHGAIPATTNGTPDVHTTTEPNAATGYVTHDARCPACNAPFAIEGQAVGHKAQCPACGRKCRVASKVEEGIGTVVYWTAPTKPAKGTSTKPAKAKGGKGKGQAKPEAPKPAKPKAKRDLHSKLSTGLKTAAALVYLLKAKAFSEASAVDRQQIWNEVAGNAVTVHLVKTGNAAVAVGEGGARGLYLTAAGRKVAQARQKQQAKAAEAAEAK